MVPAFKERAGFLLFAGKNTQKNSTQLAPITTVTQHPLSKVHNPLAEYTGCFMTSKNTNKKLGSIITHPPKKLPRIHNQGPNLNWCSFRLGEPPGMMLKTL